MSVPCSLQVICLLLPSSSWFELTCKSNSSSLLCELLLTSVTFSSCALTTLSTAVVYLSAILSRCFTFIFNRCCICQCTCTYIFSSLDDDLNNHTLVYCAAQFYEYSSVCYSMYDVLCNCDWMYVWYKMLKVTAPCWRKWWCAFVYHTSDVNILFWA